MVVVVVVVVVVDDVVVVAIEIDGFAVQVATDP